MTMLSISPLDPSIPLMEALGCTDPLTRAPAELRIPSGREARTRSCARPLPDRREELVVDPPQRRQVALVGEPAAEARLAPRIPLCGDQLAREGRVGIVLQQ